MTENDIRVWCRREDFDENEVIHMVQSDKDRTRDFVSIIRQKRKGHNIHIPRKELKWGASNGARKIIEKYLVESLFIDNSFDLRQSQMNNIDVNYGIQFSIISLDKYFPVRGRPEIPESSSRILEFKDGTPSAVHYYTNKLEKIVMANTVVCCPPSSSKDKWGPGLISIVEKLGENKNRTPSPYLLRRTAETKKRTHQGSDRSLELNMKTIEVADMSIVSDKTVIVIDDRGHGVGRRRGVRPS